MATDFNKQVDKTNDPSYLGYSRGTDNASLQPLAELPKLNEKYVSPEYKANTSFGKLFQGLGELDTDATTAADNAVKNSINRDVTKGINEVRDSFGVAAAAQNVDLARAVGQAGAEGAPTNLTGNGKLLPQDPDLPLPIQRLGTRLEGLKEQYAQGDLSDSAYYAKQEAEVSKIKSRYPGYEDHVDQVIKEKLGVDPANALRKSLQSDVEKLSAKIQAQNDKTQTWIRSNAGTISTLYGGFENFQNGLSSGKIKLPEVEAKVANYNGKVEADKAETAGIALEEGQMALRSKKVAAVVTDGLTRVVDQAHLQIIQEFKVQDLSEIADGIRSGKRPLPDPNEKMSLQSQWSLLHEKLNTAMDDYLNAPVFDAHHNTVTRRSLIGDEQKVSSLKQGAMSGIDSLGKTIFGNEAPSLMQYDAHLAKARSDASTNDLVSRMPWLDYSKAIRDRVGDDFTFDLFKGQPGDPNSYSSKAINGMKELNAGRIASGGYTISQTFRDMRGDGQNDGVTNRMLINDNKLFITKPELLKDKSVQNNAIEHLYGKGNEDLQADVLSAGGRVAGTQFFTNVTDEKTVKAISKTDSEHKQMFTSWAENAWSRVFKTEVDDINATASAPTQGQSSAQSSNFKLDYDDKTGKLRYKGTTPNATAYEGRMNQQLDGFNAALGSIKRVWEMNGETNITDKLYQWMPSAGIEPGTPVYNLIKKKYDEEHKEPKEG